MKTLISLTFAAAAAAAAPAHAVTNIGVSIGINAPGQYGRIDIDNYPQPRLVAPQPNVYTASPVAVHHRPIYLYVPQQHQANWGRYCSGYRACGQPVYFVQETWVRDEYLREHDKRNGRKDFKRGDRHEQDRNDKYDKYDKRDKGDKGDKSRGHDKHGD